MSSLIDRLFGRNSLERNETPHRLVVDRRYWGRGSNGGSLARHSPPAEVDAEASDEADENMCILGIYLHRIVKIPLTDLFGRGTPASALISPDGQAKTESLNLVADANACWLVNRHSDGRISDKAIAAEIYSINDDAAMPESEREAKITAKFAKYNVQVEFIN